MSANLLQSCPTLCDPMNCSFPGSSVHEFLQARVLVGDAMPSSRGLPDPGIKPASRKSNLHWQVGSLPVKPSGKPHFIIYI